MKNLHAQIHERDYGWLRRLPLRLVIEVFAESPGIRATSRRMRQRARWFRRNLRR